MRIGLSSILSRRRVVVHHTHILEHRIKDYLKKNDIVFFDDCLFSQYVFMKNNIDFFKQMSIDCILGFSSGLYANEHAKQTYSIESHVLHDACNAVIHCLDDANRVRDTLEEMNGFMSVPQIKDLLQLPFCHIALHGCCHLRLENEQSLLDKIYYFKKDLKEGIQQLNSFDLSTSIYVYPYVHSFYTSDRFLASENFTAIVGSTIFRIAIENLALGKDNICQC